MSDVDLNVWVNTYTTTTTVNGTAETEAIDPFANVYLDDSLRSLLGTGDGRAKLYSTLSSLPVLPAPNTSATFTVDGKLFSLTGSQLGSLENEIRKSYGVGFMGAVNQMVDDGKITEAQKKEVIFYFLHPEIAPNSPVKELLDLAQANTTKDFFPNSTPPTGFNPQEGQGFYANLYNKASTAVYDRKFEAVITAKVNAGTLTQAQANTLIFNHYHPTPGASLTPEEAQALRETQQEMGFPSTASWVPAPNAGLFDAKITSTFDDAFMEALNSGQNTTAIKDLARSSGLSEEFVAAALKFQHYHPKAVISEFTGADASTFRSLSQSITTTALSSTQALTGIPSGFAPEPGTLLQDSILNSAYKHIVGGKILDYWNSAAGQGLSESDIKQIGNWFMNPDDPSIPANIKAIAQSIKADALKAVQGENLLPGVWAPDNISSFSFVNEPVHTTIYGLDKTLEVAFAAVAKIPQPQGGMYMSFLKQVSQMLNLLKDAMYQLEAVDASQAKGMTTMQLQQSLAKVEKQKEAKAKQLEQQQMAEKMGILGKIFQPLIKLVTLLAASLAALLSPIFLALGPVGAAVAAGAGTAVAIAFGEFVDSCGGKLHLAEKMFAAVDGAFGGSGSVMGTMMKFAMTIAITAGSGGAAMELGPMLLEKSGVMQAIIKACGGDEAAQEMGAMITAVIIGAAAAIIAAIFTAGSAAVASAVDITAQLAKEIPKITAKIVEILGKVSEKAAKIVEQILEKIVKMIETIFGSLEKGIKKIQVVAEVFQQVAQGTSQLGQGIIMKQMTDVKADAEAFKEFTEAMIKILTTVINSFLDSLQGSADSAADVNKTMQKNWEQLSQSLTGLHRG